MNKQSPGFIVLVGTFVEIAVEEMIVEDGGSTSRSDR